MPTHGSYYVPERSVWPILGAVGLFGLGYGSINLLHSHIVGPLVFISGAVLIALTMFGWFHAVIKESRAGLYDAQMDRSFRWGMFWFIFSEIMFFGVFFGALFYARELSVPWLGGAGSGELTHLLIWPDFKAAWPLLANPDPQAFVAPQKTLYTWGIPAMNTLILLSSGVTITLAHWALKRNERNKLIIFLGLTIVLGLVFLSCQAYEYYLAHYKYGLNIATGIYGSTFFMLTGFHAAHVIIGAIMLFIIWLRCVKGHFTPEHHFGFEASAWYWHFVDAIWLLLFTFVYWL